MISVEVFEAERSRLFGLAYRMLGSAAEAEDVVQEAWLRTRRLDHADTPHNPAAWLTTVATRLSIDRLRSAQRRRETYVGQWLPEPMLSGNAADEGAETGDPADLVGLNESLTLGFLTVLDRLEPVDRAVFLLREVFQQPYEEVAAVVQRSEANCRQINRRARERVRQERPAATVDPDHRKELLDAFLAALFTGEPAALEPLLHDDVVLLSDGGPERRAARRPVVGPQRVARLLSNLAKRVPAGDVAVETVVVNGQPGVFVLVDAVPLLLQDLELRDGRIVAIHSILNPDKLERAHQDLLRLRAT